MMVRFIVGSIIAALTASASAAGIDLQCGEYRAVVAANGLSVNGRHYASAQEKPFAISEAYSGDMLLFTDTKDRNTQTNWAAIHIITQLVSGKKAFFYADSSHTDKNAVICTRTGEVQPAR